MISGSDISLVYSGGTSNSNPVLSIGGEASVNQITGLLNNLFDDVSTDETNEGNEDYRCFYVVNNDTTDSLHETVLLLYSQTTGGSSVEIGVETKTDVQKITITGTTTGGFFVLNYNGNITASIYYHANAGTWAGRIQQALNDLSVLSGVVVATGGTASARIFTISFEGADDDRLHGLITIDTNSLTGGVSVVTSKVANGSPANSVASELDFDTDVPNGVVFGNSGIVVGELRAGDQVPVWIKRTTLEGSDALANDGFTFRITGNPIG